MTDLPCQHCLEIRTNAIHAFPCPVCGRWLPCYLPLRAEIYAHAAVIRRGWPRARLRQQERYEEAAVTLGASRWYTFRRVTLPAIRPALVAGAVLAWARALGEFGATITFAGNFPGATQTMPLAVYLSLETNPEEAIVLALVMIAISFGVLLSLRDRWFGASNRPMQVAA